uniref:Uncharacterized protein n=1 Tax=Arundo donax TaxID=35708 RepID=A0A0A8ZTR0_ARUDO
MPQRHAIVYACILEILSFIAF